MLSLKVQRQTPVVPAKRTHLPKGIRQAMGPLRPTWGHIWRFEDLLTIVPPSYGRSRPLALAPPRAPLRAPLGRPSGAALAVQPLVRSSSSDLGSDQQGNCRNTAEGVVERGASRGKLTPSGPPQRHACLGTRSINSVALRYTSCTDDIHTPCQPLPFR